ncbi:MAG: DUF1080 domain-containing protein [Gemmatimonadaceae bacterium]
MTTNRLVFARQLALLEERGRRREKGVRSTPSSVLLPPSSILTQLAAIALAAVVFAFAGTAAAQRPNEVTPAERAAGWRLLFDGTSLAGWRGLGYDSVPTAHWRVVDGAIVKTPSAKVPRLADGQPAAGGDLMSVESFRDFELSFEWRVTPGANSGVKYNVSEELSLAHAANHAALGFEYQILDDERHPDNEIATHLAAGLYDIIAPGSAKRLRPVGEWNTARIILRGNHGEHWLNGVKVVEFDLGAPRLDSLLGRSKYRPIPKFAERRQGHIVLQDHGDEVHFRSIKIREQEGGGRNEPHSSSLLPPRTR